MKRFYTLIGLFLISSYYAAAQPFVNINSVLPAVGRSASAFADFDNDGDLDIVLAGQNSASETTGKIFLNEGGSFTEAVNAGFSGLYNSSVALADYDLDGAIDIAITGRNASGAATYLFKNNGDATFQTIESGFFTPGSDGDLAWGDYNNDGYPDMVISGGWDTRLYQNNGDGTFTEISAGLTIMNSPSVAWGDCDNDGDLDLLLVGDAGSVADVFIYLNNHGTFTRLEGELEGAVGGAARWGDYDNDGNLDILITGKDPSLVPVSTVYRNNGNSTFSFGNAGLVGTALGPADWIDYDNDGDLDIMLAGENAGCGNASTLIYNNNGAGSFFHFDAGLPFIERASSAWGDFDNDGDYDLLLSGLSGNPATYLFRNDLQSSPFQQNTLPGVPGDLYTYVYGDYAVISWGRVEDLQSPQMAITYNVMVGTSSGAIDIITPQADASTGNRFVAGPGNSGNNDFVIFRGMAPGDYYFRIQAIDQAFAGSAFSEEGTFTIISTAAETLSTPDPVVFVRNQVLQIGDLPPGNNRIIISDLTGRRLYSAETNQSMFSLPLGSFPQGLMIVQVINGNRSFTAKVLR